MGKKKLKKFAEYLTFSNCFTFPFHMRGKWHADYFNNKNPLILEVGCGKGEYTVNLAKEFKNKNFIGFDLKSNRMWQGAKIAINLQLQNVAFIRAIAGKLNLLFNINEVAEIWITFPDPYPKDRHAKHRLTHPRFLHLYHQILKPDGVIHFKTDDDALFNFTLDLLKELNAIIISCEPNVYASNTVQQYVKDIKTHYEQLFAAKGRTIKYLQFNLPNKEAIEAWLKKDADTEKKAVQ